MELSEYEKSRVRFHLGFNAGAQIPAGDRGRLEEAMALIPDDNWYREVVNHIRRCDNAWDRSEYFPPAGEGDTSVNPSRLETISGDVERTILTSDPLKGDAYFREIYLREVDRLAETLYVPNYRRPAVWRYAFATSGAEFIMAVPGPADTSVGSRIFLALNYR